MLEQFENAFSPIFVTDFGRLIASRDPHPAKAPDAIDVRESGNSIDFRKMHPEKAWSPMCLMVSGISTVIRLVYPANARLDIATTGLPLNSLGIVTVKFL